MDFKIPFSGRAHRFLETEISAVADLMRSDINLTQGIHLKKFESDFTKYFSAKNSFAVNNATSALEIVAELCAFEKGDEVIIPSHTFTSTAYPFIKRQAKPVWCDIDKDTRVVNAETISKSITNKTKAIIVVHLYGYVADMDEIRELASSNNIILIEDAAQSIGAKYKGEYSGVMGDFGVFSFHSAKNITTLGEGGMLTVKSDSLSKLLPMIRHNGGCMYDRGPDEEYWIPAMSNVVLPQDSDHTYWPGNYCIGEAESLLGSLLLERLDEMNREKRTRALLFIDEMNEFEQLRFHRVDSDRHNYHQLSGMFINEKRDDFIRTISGRFGIQCIVQYQPLNRYDFYKKLGYGDADCPNADFFYDNMVSFPFHSWMTEDEFGYIIESTKKTLNLIS